MRTPLVALGCLLMSVGVGRAQPGDDAAQRKAGAEAAFRQGKDMLAKGQTEPACMAFKQSQTLDPQFGTQYNLALCFERWGKLASAWGELTALAATDTNAARRADAAQRARALEPRLVRLLIVVKDPVAGFAIARDGSDVTALVGVATPVDPGTSKLIATAPGYLPWSLDVTLAGEGSTVTVAVGPLARTPEPSSPPPAGDDRRPVFDESVVPPDPDPGKTRRTVGLVMGGVGVVALAGGSVFAMQAWTGFDDARTECGGEVADCRGDVALAQDRVDGARSRALLATLGIGVGAAAVVGGALLYFTAPRAEPEAPTGPTVSPIFGGDRAGLIVTGRF